MMSELIALARGVLTFDTATYEAHVQARDVLKRGLLLMIVVSLLAGLVPFLGGLAGSFRRTDIAALEREVLQQIEQGTQFNPAWQDPEFQRYFQGSFREGFAIAADIQSMPYNVRFLPRWLERLLNALGSWLSTPLAWLGAWAWYALWVMLFAKLLGGRASLAKFLGATALFVVPHVLGVLTALLDLLGRVPVAGSCFGVLSGLIGFAAAVWGIAIYVKATAVANEFSLGKATLATVLPIVVMLLVAMVLAIVLVVVAVSSR